MYKTNKKPIKTRSSGRYQALKGEKVQETPEAIALVAFLEKYAPAHSTSVFNVANNGKVKGINDRYVNLAYAVNAVCESGVLPEFTSIIGDVDKTLLLANILQWLYFNVKPFPCDIWEVRGLFQKLIKAHISDLNQGRAKLKFVKNYTGTSFVMTRWLANAPGTGSSDDYWFAHFKYYLPGFVIPPNYGI